MTLHVYIRGRSPSHQNNNINLNIILYNRRRLQRDMCRVLRTRLPPALAVGNLLFPAEFHIRRSRRHCAGRSAVRRRIRHQHVGAIPSANVLRRVHADTTGMIIKLVWHYSGVGIGMACLELVTVKDWHN